MLLVGVGVVERKMRLRCTQVGVVNPLGIPGFQRPPWLPDLAPIAAFVPNIAMHLAVESHHRPPLPQLRGSPPTGCWEAASFGPFQCSQGSELDDLEQKNRSQLALGVCCAVTSFGTQLPSNHGSSESLGHRDHIQLLAVSAESFQTKYHGSPLASPSSNVTKQYARPDQQTLDHAG